MSSSLVDDDGVTRFRGRIVGGSPTLANLTRLITSAELLASNSARIQLLPAQPGRGVLPVALAALAGAGSTPYVLAGGLGLAVDDAYSSPGNMPSLSLMLSIGPVGASVSYDLLATTNQAGTRADGVVELFADAADPTGGDFDVTLTLYYLRFPPVA